MVDHEKDDIKKGSYVIFTKLNSKNKKTYDVSIDNLKGELIGIISWYGPFRKYTFRPEYNTVWDTSCLNEVIQYINQLMSDRKKRP